MTLNKEELQKIAMEPLNNDLDWKSWRKQVKMLNLTERTYVISYLELKLEQIKIIWRLNDE